MLLTSWTPPIQFECSQLIPDFDNAKLLIVFSMKKYFLSFSVLYVEKFLPDDSQNWQIPSKSKLPVTEEHSAIGSTCVKQQVTGPKESSENTWAEKDKAW